MNEKKSLKNLLLVLICAHDGEYTWYQLARELEWRGLIGWSVVQLVNFLIEANLIIQKIDPKISKDTPVYFITDDGRAKARELVDQYGLESFKIKKQNPEDYEL